MRGARPRTCVITGFGINADEELAHAFQVAGADAERVHVSDLIERPALVGSYRILAFPGGFSFGDHLGSGMVFAHLFRRHLKPALESFAAAGGLVIGICNGFQVLVKMGVLPNLSGTWEPEVSLVHNDSGRFEDRWVRVTFDRASPCPWTRGLDSMDLPVRHGEGKLVVKSAAVLDRLESGHLVALRYIDNPNGSVHDVAGICDPTGRIFGLMPHPEAFIRAENHPEWTRGGVRAGEGLAIFENGVRAARGNNSQKHRVIREHPYV